MKTFLTFLLLALVGVAYAQDPMYQTSDKESPSVYSHFYMQPLPINKDTGKIEFQKVIEVDNIDQNELYKLLKEWCAKSFVSANAVLQMDDKDAAILIAKGRLPNTGISLLSAHVGNIFDVNFILKLEAKDGRYRYTISDLVHEISVSNQIVKRSAEDLLSDQSLYKRNGKPVERIQKAKEMLLISVSDIETSIAN